MNSKALQLIRNFAYSFGSNILSLVLSTITFLIVPKLVGTETYGYYHLFLFYIGYTGVTNLGLTDGVYLRVGGKAYSDLDKRLYSSQYWLLAFSQVLIYIIGAVASIGFIQETERKVLFVFVCLYAIITNPRWLLVHILQSTNQIKRYTASIVISRITTVFFLVFFTLGIGKINPVWLYLCDLIGNTCSTVYLIITCKGIVFSRPYRLSLIKNEIKENISSGMKLTLAGLSSMLVLGVIRFSIERHWGVESFGQVSFSLSVSSMVMQVLSAMALVLYPILRQVSSEKLPSIYKVMSFSLETFGYIVMCFYYPMKEILLLWLPDYANSLAYAAILLPICLYDGKFQMILNTYFKTYRLEHKLFLSNVFSVVISVLLSLFAVQIVDRLEFAVVCVLLVLMFRSVICEFVLSRQFPISFIRNTVTEVIMTVMFVILNFKYGFIGFIAYFFVVLLFLFASRKDIKSTVSWCMQYISR